MARIRRRWWLSRGPTGHRVRRVSYEFTVTVDGRRVRRANAAWQSREDAERGLAAYLLGVEEEAQKAQAAREASATRGMTLGEAVERLLLEKGRHKSVKEYRRIVERASCSPSSARTRPSRRSRPTASASIAPGAWPASRCAGRMPRGSLGPSRPPPSIAPWRSCATCSAPRATSGKPWRTCRACALSASRKAACAGSQRPRRRGSSPPAAPRAPRGSSPS